MLVLSAIRAGYLQAVNRPENPDITSS